MNTVSIVQNPNSRRSGPSVSTPANVTARAGLSLARPAISVKQRTIAVARQEFFICFDRSGSMSGTKIAEASGATSALLGALTDNPGLRGGIIDFGSDARLLYPIASARDLVSSFRGLGESDINGGTNIGAALRLAGQALDDAQRAEPEVRRFQAIALFSDGADTEGSAPERVAAGLKAKGVTIVCVGFGSDADEATLRSIASSPAHYYSAVNGAALASIFKRVGHTLSVSVAAGVNPNAALGHLCP